METAASHRSHYALGHSAQELERLSHQGQAFGPFTRQLFEQAGIGLGMRILDVGSGAGDVAFLAAELVGPNGNIIGVDRVGVAVHWATARASSRATWRWCSRSAMSPVAATRSCSGSSRTRPTSYTA